MSGFLFDLLDIFVQRGCRINGIADKVEGEEIGVILSYNICQLLHWNHSVSPRSCVLIHRGKGAVFLGFEIVYHVSLLVA